MIKIDFVSSEVNILVMAIYTCNTVIVCMPFTNNQTHSSSYSYMHNITIKISSSVFGHLPYRALSIYQLESYQFALQFIPPVSNGKLKHTFENFEIHIVKLNMISYEITIFILFFFFFLHQGEEVKHHCFLKGKKIYLTSFLSSFNSKR